ncbi:MAG: T9SS type A sorting domain-containing protein [Crocinitomicaceae bacterium]|nr:T9SS type A sorting domain-containing protein [Crocinitomicaceae bacterium]
MKSLLLLLIVFGTSLINAKCPPVQFGSIQVTVNGLYLDIDWTTISESGNDYFVVERSSDSISFIQLGSVNGVGSSNSTENYSFTDSTANINEHYYYRIQQVDFDGSSEFLITVEYISFVGIKELSASKFKSYPNPTSDLFTIIFEEDYENIKVLIFDLTGKKVLSQSFNSTNELTVNLNDLNSAIYSYKLYSGGKFLGEGKIIKE